MCFLPLIDAVNDGSVTTVCRCSLWRSSRWSGRSWAQPCPVFFSAGGGQAAAGVCATVIDQNSTSATRWGWKVCLLQHKLWTEAGHDASEGFHVSQSVRFSEGHQFIRGSCKRKHKATDQEWKSRSCQKTCCKSAAFRKVGLCVCFRVGAVYQISVLTLCLQKQYY